MALSPTSSRSSGGSSALAVTDGTHSVASVATLDFTAGVVVSDAGGGQANASVTGAAITFTPTATKTANYSAAANEYVVGDSTGGAFTVTLPAAPVNGSVVAVQQIGSANAITVAAGVGDTINAATNTSIGTTRRSAIYQYRASDKVWFAVAPATNPVLTFAVDGTTIVNTGTATAPSVHTGTLDAIATAQPPTAAVALNAQKITGLANGTVASDAAAFGQIDVTAANTVTLTNKRVTRRTGTTASSATPTINTDSVDFYSITALAVAITSFTTNLSGTPTDGQTLWLAITDNGTARAITWGASFEASGTVALPTTTVISTRLDVGFVWNAATSKWRCVATA